MQTLEVVADLILQVQDQAADLLLQEALAEATVHRDLLQQDHLALERALHQEALQLDLLQEALETRSTLIKYLIRRVNENLSAFLIFNHE